MSNYKLVTIDPRFVAETVARTGSEEMMQKATRSFVGLYSDDESWYIPLRANLGRNKPEGTFYETKFETENRHFVRPGLDYQKAIFVPEEYVLEIKNTLPKEQSQIIFNHQDVIKEGLEDYILSVESFPKHSKDYQYSTVPLFPEGIEKIKTMRQTQDKKNQLSMDKPIHKDEGEISDKAPYKYIHKQEGLYKVTKKFVKIPNDAKLHAKNTSILDYAASKGIPLDQNSSDEYQVTGTKIKFSKRKNAFSDWGSTPRNNRNKSGGVVNFAMYMEDIGYYEAIQSVLEVEGSGTFDVSTQAREKFVMPTIFKGDIERAKNYLVKERKLAPQTIDMLHQAGLLKETKNGEVAFIWAKGNEDIGITLQGTEKIQYPHTIIELEHQETNEKLYNWLLKKPFTQTGDKPLDYGQEKTREAAEKAVEKAKSEQMPYVKRIWRNSGNGEGHGFNFKQGNQLPKEAPAVFVFTEAAIDALSYHEIYGKNFPDTRVVYQSLEGRKESIALKSIERFEEKFGKKPDNIIIALDNDKAGNTTSESLKKQLDAKGLRNQRHIPQGRNSPKDWNDQLKEMKAPQVKTQKPSPVPAPVFMKGR